MDILNSLSEGIEIPIFSNLQEISRNCQIIKSYFESNKTVGFLLKKHGLFVWGSSWEQAKKHCEILEFMFKVTYMTGAKLNF
ncbi:MAG: hypothetical protein F6J99_43545 [Moorea sp. SIO4G3]|nr:hypothetical protein [Moorena sp. SIO4G3]